MAERRRVPDELVDDVRLRRVERPAGVPDILSGEEDAAPEMAEKGAVGHQPRDGLHRKAGRPSEDPIDVGKLRDALAIERDERGALPVLAAYIALVQGSEVLPDGPPDPLLVLGVLDGRNGIALAILHRDPRDRVAPGAIRRVPEPGMLGIEVDEIRRGYLVAALHEPFTIPRRSSPAPSGAPGDQGAGGRPFDVRALLIVRGIPGLHGSKLLLPLLQVLRGPLRVELLGPDRFLHEDADPVVVHLREPFAGGSRVRRPAGDVEHLAGREGSGEGGVAGRDPELPFHARQPDLVAG